MKLFGFAMRLICLLILFVSVRPSVMGQNQVNGTVVDEETGTPLVGARVLLPAGQTGAMTNESGQFEINTSLSPPFDLLISYFGYDTLNFQVSDISKKLKLQLKTSEYSLNEVEISSTAKSEADQRSPLTVESLSINAIKETPAVNFYDGLGALKEVDLTSASLGFKVINTRGFNSTSPVRSLQIIDGVDNQAPGLNFALGNFVGSSELDVEQVDLIVGASSAFYGPNAFNGVISMTTKNPFIHRGLSVSAKTGERGLVELGLRYAKVFSNKDGVDKLAFKINASYMQANDWEADNLDPVFESPVGSDNPGGYDAVNRYGDERPTNGLNDATNTTDQILFPGLGLWYRTGYEEVDLVDYDARNLKLAGALHYKLTPKIELIGSSSFGTGTTVYQGDNRYSLKDILFFQHRLEIREENKFFLRGYATHEDAGNSYDAVFTAFRLQDRVKTNLNWSTDYRNFWAGIRSNSPFYIPPTNGDAGIRGRVRNLPGFPPLVLPIDPDTYIPAAQAVYAQFPDSMRLYHDLARNYADNFQFPRLVPGTPEFQQAFDEITSTPIAEGGTRFVDRSSLFHVHGEYKFNPTFANITVGANVRWYRPVSEGNIFSDTLQVRETIRSDGSVERDSSFKEIRNFEYGAYAGISKSLLDNRLDLNATLRVDKNQNFDFISSYAASAVYSLNQTDVIRVSLSSAIRNPTLQDQFLYYNVGGARLIGNLDGFQNLVDTASLNLFLADPSKDQDLLNYFDVNPIRPEQVLTVELGYRSVFFERLYLDASYYFSRYRDFIGFNLGVDLAFSPIFPDQLIAAQVFRVAANATDIVTTQGFSVGLNYYFPKGYTLGGNYSWNKLNTDSEDPIIPAFNTPEHKFNVSFSGRKIRLAGVRDLGFSVNYKWIEGFLFEGSPQFTGIVPTYDLLDVQINKYFPALKSTFKLGASNLLNNEQFQVYGGPRVGRLAYFSIVTEISNL